jgi:hypothetical protein
MRNGNKMSSRFEKLTQGSSLYRRSPCKVNKISQLKKLSIFLQICKLTFEEFTKQLFTVFLFTVEHNAINMLAYAYQLNVTRFPIFYIIFMNIICSSVK